MTQGYTLKNRIVTAFESIVLPSGTSAQRPSDPDIGATRFNTTNGNLEVFNGTSFESLAVEGLIDLTVDTFTGDGSTVVFGSMTNTVDSADAIMVFIEGVYQTPTTNYTVDGSYDITFTGVPPNGATINVIHNLNSTQV